jgi:hypothetical protein
MFMAEPARSNTVSWRVTLRVWWAMSWRFIGLFIIFIMPIYLLLGHFLRPEVIGLICQPLMLAFSVTIEDNTAL